MRKSDRVKVVSAEDVMTAFVNRDAGENGIDRDRDDQGAQGELPTHP